MAVVNHVARQRIKLLLIFIIFAAPIVTAWGMVEWRIGVPDETTAHGSPTDQVPSFELWPIAPMSDAPVSEGRWILAFDCSLQCAERRDLLWRMHRALGRDANRLTRMSIGGEGEPLPGEALAAWRETPRWSQPNKVWLIDPEGRPALAFSASVPAADILDDTQHLFKVNAR
ncbi:hypothetical protein LPL18_008735 [Halomonas sp. CUBES01]|uniref:hypothetical protein n=1 Tax=Halomonas sp. CUBES01 TaxID=2897340 RepID=UPI001E585DEB|nr:hypothetical protein [Halomonas sp. CUBES01]MEC4767420.1 hypothetical protein [Halomonas sp. CUBES01]